MPPSIEKALKAIYYKKFKKTPPKLHNLMYFVKECELQPEKEMYIFIYNLSNASIPTRYPEDLKTMYKHYDEKKTRETLSKTREALQWVKRNL